MSQEDGKSFEGQVLVNKAEQVEKKVEKPLEKSRADFVNADRILKNELNEFNVEARALELTLRKLTSLQKENRSRNSAYNLKKLNFKADSTLGYSSLLKQINERLAKAGESLAVGKTFANQAETFAQKINNLNLSSFSNIKNLKGLVEDFQAALNHAQEYLASAEDLPREAKLLDEQSREKFAQENGFESREDFNWEKVYAPKHKAEALERERMLGIIKIGKYKHKEEISGLTKEFGRLKKLKDILDSPDLDTGGLVKQAAAEYLTFEGLTNGVMIDITEKIKDFFLNNIKQSKFDPSLTTPISLEKIVAIIGTDSLPSYGMESLEKAPVFAVQGQVLLKRKLLANALHGALEEFSPVFESVVHSRLGLSKPGNIDSLYDLPEESSLRSLGKNIPINAWKKLRKSRDFQDVVPPDQSRQFEDAIATYASESLLSLVKYQAVRSGEGNDYKTRIMAFGGADLAPLAFTLSINTIRNQEYLENINEFSDMCKRLTTEQLSDLQQVSPGLARAAELVSINEHDYYRDEVLNPEFSALTEKLGEDPEIIDYYCTQWGGPPSAELSDEELEEYKKQAKEGAAYFGSMGSDNDTAWGKTTGYFLEKYGYDPDIINHKMIPNPVRKEILENVGKTAVDMFAAGSDDEKIIAMDNIRYMEEIVDLTPIAKWYENLKSNAVNHFMMESFTKLAIHKSGQGQKTLAWEYYKKYSDVNLDSAPNNKSFASLHYAGFAGKELSPEEELLISRAVGQPIETLRKVNILVRELRGLKPESHAYQQDKFLDYIKISQIPNANQLINRLCEYKYHFDPADADNLERVSGKIDKITEVLKFLGQEFVASRTGFYLAAADNLRVIEEFINMNSEMAKKLFKSFRKNLRMMEYIGDNPEKFGEVFALYSGINLRFSKIYDLTRIYEVLEGNLNKIMSVPEGNREAHIEIILKIDNSPSQEIQKIREQLIAQLMDNPNPVAAYDHIEQIFIKNNIPNVGKIFKIFSVLYPPTSLERRLRNGRTSPVLNGMSTKRKYYTIYRDLLKSSIDSGNRSLRDYAAVLFQGQQYLDKAETLGWQELLSEEKDKLGYILKKFKTLLENSTLGVRNEVAPIDSGDNLQELYLSLRRALGVKEGQKISDRVSEMYLRPIGIKDLRELLHRMSQAKASAHDRNLDLVKKSENGHLSVQPGDMFKGVDINFISNILQNGSVAKEFLGASSQEDQTPMDTDVAVVLNGETDNGFKGALEKSMANQYAAAGLLFCIRDRGQFQKSQIGQPAKYDSSKLELFQTGGDQHYGIRTGFPVTEIDFMVAKPNLVSSRNSLENIYFEIAQNDFYIPVVDEEGKILFTPEMYRQYRNIFAGLDRFGNRHLRVNLTRSSDRSFSDIEEIKKTSGANKEQVLEVGRNIRQAITATLEKTGIKLKPEYDTSIIGAELVDTGSTGRGTNLLDSFDFDFSLKLDALEIKNIEKISSEIMSQFVFQKRLGGETKSNYIQLRMQGVTSIGGVELPQPVDIDIGVGSKSELRQFETQDALKEKMEYIKTRNGEEAYEDTLANIVLAKRILKQAHAYKKANSDGGEGGFAGVGTENWILANNGNMLDAFTSFKKAAYDVNGTRLPFEEFKKRYQLYDAGINIKKQRHDNFIEVLNEQGYSNMLVAIEKYIA